MFRLLVASFRFSRRRCVAGTRPFVYIVTFVILLVPSSARSKLYICPAQVSSSGPVQDVLPLTMFQDGVYVSGEL